MDRPVIERVVEPAVGRSGIINAVSVSNQTISEGTNIEQRIPIGAVAGQTLDFNGEDDPHFTQRHLGDDVFEALALMDGGAANPQVGVDNFNGFGGPTQAQGSLLERILKSQALLIGQDLMGARLPNVNDGFASQMAGRDQF